MNIEIAMTGLVTFLLLLVEHYFPWNMLLRRKLPRVAAYTMGVLGLVIPLSVLLVRWQAWEYLAALWVVIGCGGGAVLMAYGLDHVLDRMTLATELEELMRLKNGGTIEEDGSGEAGSL